VCFLSSEGGPEREEGMGEGKRRMVLAVASALVTATVLWVSFLHTGALDPLVAILPIATLNAFVPGFIIGVMHPERAVGTAALTAWIFAIVATVADPMVRCCASIAVFVAPVAVGMAALGAHVGRVLMRRVLPPTHLSS